MADQAKTPEYTAHRGKLGFTTRGAVREHHEQDYRNKTYKPNSVRDWLEGKTKTSEQPEEKIKRLQQLAQEAYANVAVRQKKAEDAKASADTKAAEANRLSQEYNRIKAVNPVDTKKLAELQKQYDEAKKQYAAASKAFQEEDRDLKDAQEWSKAYTDEVNKVMLEHREQTIKEGKNIPGSRETAAPPYEPWDPSHAGTRAAYEKELQGDLQEMQNDPENAASKYQYAVARIKQSGLPQSQQQELIGQLGPAPGAAPQSSAQDPTNPTRQKINQSPSPETEKMITEGTPLEKGYNPMQGFGQKQANPFADGPFDPTRQKINLMNPNQPQPQFDSEHSDMDRLKNGTKRQKNMAYDIKKAQEAGDEKKENKLIMEQYHRDKSTEEVAANKKEEAEINARLNDPNTSEHEKDDLRKKKNSKGALDFYDKNKTLGENIKGSELYKGATKIAKDFGGGVREGMNAANRNMHSYDAKMRSLEGGGDMGGLVSDKRLKTILSVVRRTF